MPLDLSALLQSAIAAQWLALLGTGETVFAVDEERFGRAARAPDPNAPKAPSSVAVIPLHGALTPRGAGSMESFRSRLFTAGNHPDVGAIVLDVDSPGGTVAGTAETADAIRQVREMKPVIAHVDTLGASAAYWISSQASQVWVSPSAEVGSIGVMGVHMDVSKLLGDMGVVPTLIKSAQSQFKAELSPLFPLSPEAKENVQAKADAEAENFIRAVSEGRKTSLANVRENFGQGRVFGAQRAVELGMADKIGTLADVLGSLRTKSGAVRRRTALAFA